MMDPSVPDIDGLIEDTKARHARAIADGARVVDFNNAGVYWSTTAEGPCPSLFEQIYTLDYPVEAKLDSYRALSDFERFTDRLAELMRPYAERLSKRLGELRPAYETVAEAWFSRINSRGLDCFEPLLKLTEASLETAEALEVNIGMFLFNEAGFGAIPGSTGETVMLYIGMGVYPGFERGYDEHRAERLAETFRLLADPAKLDLLSRLAKKRSYCLELSKQTGVNPGNVSRNLTALADCGLLERQRVGGRTYYTTDPAALKKAFIDAEVLILDPEI